MVVYDNIKVNTYEAVPPNVDAQMFDMATECGAAINIENNQVPNSAPLVLDLCPRPPSVHGNKANASLRIFE
jgi:hypothetical protein